jgi:hypothetical protein
MPPVGFEPTLSAGERPQTFVLDRAVIGIGTNNNNNNNTWMNFISQIKYINFNSLPFVQQTKETSGENWTVISLATIQLLCFWDRNKLKQIFAEITHGLATGSERKGDPIARNVRFENY